MTYKIRILLAESKYVKRVLFHSIISYFDTIWYKNGDLINVKNALKSERQNYTKMNGCQK